MLQSEILFLILADLGQDKPQKSTTFTSKPDLLSLPAIAEAYHPWY